MVPIALITRQDLEGLTPEEIAIMDPDFLLQLVNEGQAYALEDSDVKA